jgi:hypothetical protein
MTSELDNLKAAVEALVIDWLAARGADVSLANDAMSIELWPAAQAHCVVAAMESGVWFTEYGPASNPNRFFAHAFDAVGKRESCATTPWLALVALVEAAE